MAGSDSFDGEVYAVLRVRDASGEVDITVGQRRYLAVFLYKPKAVSQRDRLYLRLLASDAVESSGFTQHGIDIAGVVVATDAAGGAPRLVLRGARITLRVTTVQRGGVDLPPEALWTGRLDAKPPPPPKHAPRFLSTRAALPSWESEPVAPARAVAPKSGTLAARTIHDLVADLVDRGVNASIEVTADHGLGGSIFVEAGVVVAAWAGGVRGLEAVLKLATYIGGRFLVRPGCTTVMRNVQEPPVLVLRALATLKPGQRSGAVFSDEPTFDEAAHGSLLSSAG